MALLRVVALSATAALAGIAELAGLGACRASEAGPTSGLTPPAGWRAAPDIAAAVGEGGRHAGSIVHGAEAWAEPGRGCYATWVSLTSDGGAPNVLADLVVRALTSEPVLAGITVANVVKPAAGADAGILSLVFTRPPYQGALRAQIGSGGSYAVLACFWNQREPAACATACNALVGSMK